MTTIHAYAGGPGFKGISFDSLHNTSSKLRSILPDSEIEYLDSDELSKACEKKDESKRQLIVFPGGVCSEWDPFFNSEMLSKIRKAVEDGSSGLFICAGAYFASSKSCFKTEYAVFKKKRDLKLYTGKVKGPYFPEKSRHHVENGRIVPILWEQTKETGFVFINGGGYFKRPYPDKAEVLASYEDGKAAIISLKARQGKIVLSFVHLEYDELDPEIFSDNLSLRSQFVDSQDFRKACWTYITEILK